LGHILQSIKSYQKKNVHIKWICIGEHAAFKTFFQLILSLEIFNIKTKYVEDIWGMQMLCQACPVTLEQIENPFYRCKFISMTNELCHATLQLYKPEEYGIGIELDKFSELEIKQAKEEAHEKLKKLPQHMHLNACCLVGNQHLWSIGKLT